jgi:hypothetical protein
VDIATRHKKTPDKQWFCLLFFLLRAPDIMHTTKIYTRSKSWFSCSECWKIAMAESRYGVHPVDTAATRRVGSS